MSDISNGMIGRDHVTRYFRDTADAFGEDWQVDEDIDERLFMTSGKDQCTYFTGDRRELINSDDAESLCAAVLDTDLRRDCVFDVITTGDASWATTDVYTVPWDELFPPTRPMLSEEQCEATGCEEQGGTCVWRCNENEFKCDTSGCKGVEAFDEYSSIFLKPGEVNGCACAIPIIGEELRTSCSQNWLLAILQFLLGWFIALFGLGPFCT